MKEDVPVEIVESRRLRLAASWSLESEVVLIGSGEPIAIPGGADQTFPYRPHPHFFWLSGKLRAGSYVAYDPISGWREFLKGVSENEQVWEGKAANGVVQEGSGVDDWLRERSTRPLVCLGSCAKYASALPNRQRELEVALLEARRIKDEYELKLMRAAVEATAAAFENVPRWLEVGISERELQIEFEASMLRAGGDGLAFDTIVAFGRNSAVLHCTPGDVRLQSGELVLIDAGAQVNGYCADVTRVFVQGANFAPEQQALRDLVCLAQRTAIDHCRKGVWWHEVHRVAARVLAAGLQGMGVLTCSPDRALESEVVALFFPHGIGHLVGLGVRDAAPLAGSGSAATCCGITLRVDVALQEGMTMTVEPGVYFIPALLRDPKRRERFQGLVAWERAEGLCTVGGVRIEDNILVTGGEAEVLTARIAK